MRNFSNRASPDSYVRETGFLFALDQIDESRVIAIESGVRVHHRLFRVAAGHAADLRKVPMEIFILIPGACPRKPFRERSRVANCHDSPSRKNLWCPITSIGVMPIAQSGGVIPA